jgi:hypothetical protein
VELYVHQSLWAIYAFFLDRSLTQRIHEQGTISTSASPITAASCIPTTTADTRAAAATAVSRA